MVQKQKEKITISLEKRINVISHQGAMERAAARGAGGVAPGMELGVEDNKLYCCVQLLLLSIMGCCVGLQFQILIAFVISHLAISDSDCFYNFPPCRGILIAFVISFFAGRVPSSRHSVWRGRVAAGGCLCRQHQPHQHRPNQHHN